jgi:hypothetical protein
VLQPWRGLGTVKAGRYNQIFLYVKPYTSRRD